MPEERYTESHQGAGHGRQYDQMYGRGYYRHLWHRVEMPLLRAKLDALPYPRRGSVAVDLACGTGRVTRVVAERFGTVIGADVSSDMLERAREASAAVRNVEFRTLDLGDRTAVARFRANVSPVDCVTAFRLFTNADDRLRSDAARAAASLLPPGGTFLANLHILPGSPVGSVYRMERAIRRRIGSGQRPFNSVYPLVRFVSLLADTGFEVTDTAYYAAFPAIPKLQPHIPHSFVEGAEERFGGRPWNQCVMVTARRTAMMSPE